ncbi:LamG-like jellyroll fold domain-containing protein [Luteolibacter sp. Populi]|uniref:LamG-like jellyroll fold domain-containing protein n=1 Tax=Luteolibacter sp. Populi TaxID=3230487 RepID=UPI003466EB45
MKTGSILLNGLMACLAGTASRAAVYPWAEYHLGEAGSLNGANKNPQDSSGAGRHFLGGYYSGSAPATSIAVPPAAIGSTACLDASMSGDQSWDSGGMSFATLPKNNFAFGIFAKGVPPGSGYGNVIFGLGDNDGAFAIVQSNSIWRLWAYHSSGEAGLAGNYTANTWAHLAVIRNAGVTRFYVDGVDQGTPFNTEPVHGNPLLGRSFTYEGSQAFNGLMDEARVVTFSEGETAANIIAALQGGAVPGAFVTVGSNAAFPKANLSSAEASVFRIVNGQLKDSVQVLDSGGLAVAGTTPAKHVIQVNIEGLIALGRYPLIDYTGVIGGQGIAGLELGSLPGGVTATLEDNLANTTVDLVISATPGLTWTGSGGNVWDVGDSNNWVLDGTSTAATFANSKQVSFNDSTAATTNVVAIAEIVSPSIVGVDASESYSFSGAGIGGTASLLKRGTGTLTLTNANTNSGTTTIFGGILSVGDGGTGGNLGSGTIALSGGQLLVNRSGEVTLPNLLTGTGAIGKLGAGRLVLGAGGGSNAFTGPVTITAGEVVAARAGALSGVTVTIAAGASFDMAGFYPGAYFIINGSGVNGQGALQNNTVSGVPDLNIALSLGSDASVGGGWRTSTPAPLYPLPYPEDRVTMDSNFKLTKVGSGEVSFTRTDIRVKDLVIDGGRIVMDQSAKIHNTYPGTITLNGGALEFVNRGYLERGFPMPTNAKPLVMNGGEVGASGGYAMDFNISLPVLLNGGGGSFRAERNPVTVTFNGAMPPASLHVGGVVSGSGPFVMRGYGTVTLSQPPAYTGDTSVLGEIGAVPYYRGRLKLMAKGLHDASAVNISTGRVLELAFSGTDTVSKLFIGGAQQQAGVYQAGHVSGCFAGTGSLTVTSGPAAPPYQMWEIAHGIAGAGGNADSDQDGIDNAMEYVIGGDPSGPDSDSSALLPVITRSGGNVVFVFRRTDASLANYPTQVSVSTSLAADEWMPAYNIAGSSMVDVDDGFGPGVDKVTITFPMEGTPELFVRLGVEIP